MTKEKSTLHLVLKRRWWNMIASGEKTEEYRDIKDFYINRMCKNNGGNSQSVKQGERGLIQYEEVCFQLGFTKRSMTFKIKEISIGYGRPEWGAEPNKEYFVIHIGEKINGSTTVKSIDFIRQKQKWSDFDRDIIICEQGSVFIETYKKARQVGAFKVNVYLYGLWVNKEFRKQYIGERLLAEAEKTVKDCGYDEIYLDWEKTTPLWVFNWYVKNGYEEIAFGDNGALMRKVL